MKYQFDDEGIDWGELEALFRAAELDGRAGDKIRRAFENSQLVCFVHDGARLIAAARALTDWEYHGLIYDVVVHPDYQRQGVGSQMLGALLKRLRVWRVMLVSDGETKEFYRRLGFDDYSDVMARLEWDNLYD